MPRKNTPRKDQKYNEFLDWFIKYQKDLEGCGALKVREYIQGIKQYVSLCKAHKWLVQYLEPVMDEYLSRKNMYTPDQWKRLITIDKNHPDIKDYSAARGKVRDMWNKRPRFPFEGD